jgi:hypothetical protein
VSVVYGMVAVVASLLPARHWERFPALPMRKAVLPSAVLTIVAGAVVGLGGFLAYSDRVGRETGALIVKAAEAQLAGKLPNDPNLNAAPIAVAALTPFAFLFTPLGLLATYLIVSGGARALSWVVDEPWGDPILTGIDAIGHRASGRARDSHRRRARERAEGVEVPDRLYPAAWADLTDADLVVVSSRRKPDWDKGTFVITPEQWYVLGEPFDRQLPEGLRTIYPLKELKTNDVMRRGVSYQLPPLRKSPSTRVARSGQAEE